MGLKDVRKVLARRAGRDIWISRKSQKSRGFEWNLFRLFLKGLGEPEDIRGILARRTGRDI